jgi:hypothetical protein
MQLFDLVFIVCFVCVVFYGLCIIWLLVRWRRKAVVRHLKRLGCFVAVYLAAVIAVSLLSPQRVFHVGDTRCFDDWCIGVQDAKASELIGTNVHPVRGRFLFVTLRVSSRARRVRQSEPNTRVYLLDAHGSRYEVAEAAQRAFEETYGNQLPVGTMLDPGGSFSTVRVFDVPRDLQEIGLGVRQSGLGPGLFVIGDDGSLFHKVSIVLIPIPAER